MKKRRGEWDGKKKERINERNCLNEEKKKRKIKERRRGKMGQHIHLKWSEGEKRGEERGKREIKY